MLKRKSQIEDEIGDFEEIYRRLNDVEAWVELLEEEEEGDTSELVAEIGELSKRLERMELLSVMTGPHDKSSALLSINPGAGGTESQDWAYILLRMYTRWAANKGYEVKMLDVQQADDAGIKGATIQVIGPYAYGYLKAESGVHRLVRISPFDANHRRHTSFASVFAFPEIDDSIDVEINEKDLKIDTFRSSGPGGQHVNVTDSAVRITHLPTGIVVQCQNERSQIKNRDMAMKVLRARLYELKRQEREKELAKMSEGKKEIAWGSQIRSYVLHPYQLVKDHRTGVEKGDTEGVLNGEIDEFIEAYLRKGR